MKIVRLTTLLDFGGQEKQYLSFTEVPKHLKHKYIFAAIGYGGYASEEIRKRGFNVKIFNQNPAIKNLKNIWVLYKWFKKEKPTVVHTAAAEANFHGIIAAKLANIPIIIGEEIGYPNHSKTAKLFFSLIYKTASSVVCVSEAVKSYLISIGEINKEKGVVLYNPVSAPKNVNRKLNEYFTIVSVGRLVPVKNYDKLIVAFSKTENKKTKLIIVGEGSERKKLEQLILNLNLKDRLSLVGFTPEPENYLAQANLFVLPSLSEGFGIALVEAMNLGIPCLGSNIGGIPEIIEEGKTGFLFNPLTESDLVNILNKLGCLPQSELDKIGAQAKIFSLNKFSTKQYIQNLENLYSNLIHTKVK